MLAALQAGDVDLGRFEFNAVSTSAAFAALVLGLRMSNSSRRLVWAGWGLASAAVVCAAVYGGIFWNDYSFDSYRRRCLLQSISLRADSGHPGGRLPRGGPRSGSLGQPNVRRVTADGAGEAGVPRPQGQIE